MQSNEASNSSEVNSSTLNNEENNIPSTTMAEKLDLASPYNIFFNRIPKSSPTLKQTNSITFKDLLCPSLGELSCSLQTTFHVSLAWLLEKYQEAGLGSKRLTIVYGCISQGGECETPNNVTEVQVKCKDLYGIHHSKIGMYVYTDKSVRIVVSTANLYRQDWEICCNGLWVSPRLEPLPMGSLNKTGESPTGFKAAFISYLNAYDLPVLKKWIYFAKRVDFSPIKVFLVSSVPGVHNPTSLHSHLYSLGSILSNHFTLPEEANNSSILAQASVIGLLGQTEEDWLRSVLLRSLASHQNDHFPKKSNVPISIVFPSKSDVLNSYDGPEGGICLVYRQDIHENQIWVNNYLHCWKADVTARSNVIPHIKTYCRISSCLSELFWFFLTSANISRSSWGSNMCRNKTSYVRSFEAGVLFVPKFFDETCFRIKGNNAKLFPFIYDLPLTPYSDVDQPFTRDVDEN